MATAPNPFAIDIAQPDLSPVMEGIGALVKSSRDAAKKKVTQDELMAAVQSNDPSKMAEIAIKYPEYADAAKNAFGFTNTASEKQARDTYSRVLSDPSNAVKYLQEGIEQVTSAGGKPTMMGSDLQMLMENPESALQKIELGMATIDPKWHKAFKSGSGDPEFLKEERKNAAQDVRAFNTQAKAMRSDYGKLQGLAKQAESGNRGARNAMVVTLSRLISPGIVTEKEAASLSGGQNTLQFVMGALQGKGVDTKALERYIDPYGGSFDTKGLLGVGESVVASSRQPLIDMYEGSRDRASRAKMGSGAFDTNFGGNKNYEFLKGFESQEGAQLPQGVTEDDISETMRANNMTREQVLQAIGNQ